jgi:hypothetical protein
MDIATMANLATAASMARGMTQLKTDAAVAMKAMELYGVILELRDAQGALSLENHALQRKIAELQEKLDAKADLSRYLLMTLPTDVKVYKSPEGEMPEHFLCPDCYTEGKKKILQPAGQHALRCMSCSFVCKASPEAKPVRHRPNWRII